jgi:hypothetical protein
MARLIAAGCSCTYGHGLPDCSQGPDHVYGPEPSQLAWPSICAAQLGLACVNLSQPGSSNISILLSLLQHAWAPGDVAAVLWSFPQRDTLFGPDGDYRVLCDDQPIDRQYLAVHSDDDMQLRTWIYHDHAHARLRVLGIPLVMTSLDAWPRGRWPGEDHRDITADQWGSLHCDKGTDGRHPGVVTHDRWGRLMAKLLLQKIPSRMPSS